MSGRRGTASPRQARHSSSADAHHRNLDASHDGHINATARRGEVRPQSSRDIPADDGKGELRRRIHAIRDEDVSMEDKGRKIHAVMMEAYEAAAANSTALQQAGSPAVTVKKEHGSPQLGRAQRDLGGDQAERPGTPTSLGSPLLDSSPRSPQSMAEWDPENPFNLNPGDLVPTYQPRKRKRSETLPSHQHGLLTRIEPQTDTEEFEEDNEPELGCVHYKRNVKVQCADCRRWYTCRQCHDQVESHRLDRTKTTNMLCMLCSKPQPAAPDCVHCGEEAAYYYCDICKLWENDATSPVYHCPDCGICRRGEGLGKDYHHCKKCNVCLKIQYKDTHRCFERATEGGCPICGDDLFDSPTAPVVQMRCGHYMHQTCYNGYIQTAYKCPICKQSAVNMELQWKKTEQAIQTQPMPPHLADVKVNIRCNDCGAKTNVPYHWLGSQCRNCDSFNTDELRPHGSERSVSASGADGGLSTSLDARVCGIPRRRSPMLLSPMGSPGQRSYFLSEQEDSTTAGGGGGAGGEGGGGEERGSAHYYSSYMLNAMRFSPYEVLERFSTSDVLERFSPYDVLERFSRSFSPIRNYIGEFGGRTEDDHPVGVPHAAATDSHEDVDFWGSDGGRFLSGGEEEDVDGEEEEEASSDEEDDSSDEGLEDESEDYDEEELDPIPLIGHR